MISRPAAASSQADRVIEAADAVRARGAIVPRVAVILGSGLGDLADEIQSPVVLPFGDIPHFPVSTVQGHAGHLVLGQLQGTPVAAMRGRVHFYEGYNLRDVTFPVRVMRRLGADVLIVTNAAGGLNETFSTGDLMVLTDHLNIMGMAGQSPLVGPDEPVLGVRFLDMLGAYDAQLRSLAHRAARDTGFSLREGVYAMVGGPAFETMAEIRFLQRGGDVDDSRSAGRAARRHARARDLGHHGYGRGRRSCPRDHPRRRARRRREHQTAPGGGCSRRPRRPRRVEALHAWGDSRVD